MLVRVRACVYIEITSKRLLSKATKKKHLQNWICMMSTRGMNHVRWTDAHASKQANKQFCLSSSPFIRTFWSLCLSIRVSSCVPYVQCYRNGGFQCEGESFPIEHTRVSFSSSHMRTADYSMNALSRPNPFRYMYQCSNTHTQTNQPANTHMHALMQTLLFETKSMRLFFPLWIFDSVVCTYWNQYS